MNFHTLHYLLADELLLQCPEKAPVLVEIVKEWLGEPYSEEIKNKSLPDHEYKGDTYDPNRDKRRLDDQMTRVFSYMRDGRWRTKREIAEATGSSEHALAARFSDFKKLEWGTVEKRHVRDGLWQYRLVLPN